MDEKTPEKKIHHAHASIRPYPAHTLTLSLRCISEYHPVTPSPPHPHLAAKGISRYRLWVFHVRFPRERLVKTGACCVLSNS
ncbi:hypothetical protein E2C01_100116 [Portunus trituberculatus]|uniref:Uncharacterized protein n=1 Tax=Portunus trituberculatus TaxID=210409 RepID=A0A5B7KB81_PORTR|nr:hypothetical protein [Portunus trituberculatus]